jgi:hypothetical protein
MGNDTSRSRKAGTAACVFLSVFSGGCATPQAQPPVDVPRVDGRRGVAVGAVLTTFADGLAGPYFAL